MAELIFRNIDENEHDLFTDAIDFSVQKFIPRLNDKLDIEITGHWGMDVLGDCDWLDTNDRPRMFDIRLGLEMTTTKRLIVLFHELVHMKQYAKGELMNYMGYRSDGIEMLQNKDVVKWQGKKFVVKDKDYYDFPWEIEAHGRETGLFHTFLEKHKKYKNIVDQKSVD